MAGSRLFPYPNTMNVWPRFVRCRRGTCLPLLNIVDLRVNILVHGNSWTSDSARRATRSPSWELYFYGCKPGMARIDTALNAVVGLAPPPRGFRRPRARGHGFRLRSGCFSRGGINESHLLAFRRPFISGLAMVVALASMHKSIHLKVDARHLDNMAKGHVGYQVDRELWIRHGGLHKLVLGQPARCGTECFRQIGWLTGY